MTVAKIHQATHNEPNKGLEIALPKQALSTPPQRSESFSPERPMGLGVIPQKRGLVALRRKTPMSSYVFHAINDGRKQDQPFTTVPPLGCNVCPLMAELSELAKNTTHVAISLG
jgi:hypothetical protein